MEHNKVNAKKIMLLKVLHSYYTPIVELTITQPSLQLLPGMIHGMEWVGGGGGEGGAHYYKMQMEKNTDCYYLREVDQLK